MANVAGLIEAEENHIIFSTIFFRNFFRIHLGNEDAQVSTPKTGQHPCNFFFFWILLRA